MLEKTSLLILSVVSAVALTGCPPEEPDASPSDTPYPSETYETTPTAAPTGTPAPTPEATPTEGQTATPTSTATATPTACEDSDLDGVCVSVDCDDDDAEQGGPEDETCDGLDNDCDGNVDEDAPGAYFPDDDGDGYGNQALPSCEEGEGLVSQGGDCDDTNADINPDADDIWENGVDEDCSGEDRSANIYVYTNIEDVPESVGEERLHQSITNAIAAAFTGHTIAVAPGTYIESLDFGGKDLQLISMHGPEMTIIDAAQNGSAIKLTRGEGFGAECRVEGFTLQGGDGTPYGEDCGLTPGFQYGGAICAEGASVYITNNIIKGNEVTGSGGGMYLKDGTFYVWNNHFEGNEAGFDGGGLNLSDVEGDVYDNVFQGNQAFRTGGGLVVIDTDITVRDNIIAYNRVEGATSPPNGGGLFISTGAPKIINNIIAYNYAEDFGGGLSLAEAGAGTVIGNNLIIHNTADNSGGGLIVANLESGSSLITNNTVVGNIAEDGGGFYIITGNPVLNSNILAFNQGESSNLFAEPSSALDLTSAYNVFWSNAGSADVTGITLSGSDITGDPKFVNDPTDFDTTNDDFHLTEGSAAIDVGDPSASFNDVDGSRNDAGAYGGPMGEDFSFDLSEIQHP